MCHCFIFARLSYVTVFFDFHFWLFIKVLWPFNYLKFYVLYFPYCFSSFNACCIIVFFFGFFFQLVLFVHSQHHCKWGSPSRILPRTLNKAWLTRVGKQDGRFCFLFTQEAAILVGQLGRREDSPTFRIEIPISGVFPIETSQNSDLRVQMEDTRIHQLA